MTPEEKNQRRHRMLAYIRDTLVDRAQCFRSAYESNSLDYERTPEAKAHLKQIMAIEAAANVFTHLVGEWDKAKDKPPEWLQTIAKQGMATFVEGLR